MTLYCQPCHKQFVLKQHHVMMTDSVYLLLWTVHVNVIIIFYTDTCAVCYRVSGDLLLNYLTGLNFYS